MNVSLIQVFTVGVLASLISTQAACAHRSASGSTSVKSERAPVITGNGGETTNPLGTLEHALAKVKSDRVTVSTSLLKSLVRNQRLQQSQCKNLSGQLEALKNIDLQETGETKE